MKMGKWKVKGYTAAQTSIGENLGFVEGDSLAAGWVGIERKEERRIEGGVGVGVGIAIGIGGLVRGTRAGGQANDKQTRFCQEPRRVGERSRRRRGQTVMRGRNHVCIGRALLFEFQNPRSRERRKGRPDASQTSSGEFKGGNENANARLQGQDAGPKSDTSHPKTQNPDDHRRVGE